MKQANATGSPRLLAILATHRPKTTEKALHVFSDLLIFPAHLTHNQQEPTTNGRDSRTAVPQDTVPNSGNRDDQPTHSSSKGCRVTLVQPPDTCGGVGAEPGGCCIWSRFFPELPSRFGRLVGTSLLVGQQFVPCLPRFVVCVGKQIHTHIYTLRPRVRIAV